MAKFKVGEPVLQAKVSNVLSRGKVFVMFFEGMDEPVLLPKVIAAEDGYVHRTQLAGLTVDVTPTQASNGTMPGFLGTVDLPMAGYSNNALLATRQNTANNYAMAKLYAAATVEEN